MNKQILITAAVGMVMFAASSMATACELGRAQYNSAGQQQISVIDSSGQQVGTTLQGSDGRWEAVVEHRGALNQRFNSPRDAAQAICQEAEG